jgi:predicted DNA-binding transcriptional regulator AlpA
MSENDTVRLFPTPPMLLRLPAVLERSGYSESGLYEAMARGEFPRPRRRGGTAVWVESEVSDAIARQIRELPVAEPQATRGRRKREMPSKAA